MAFCNTALHHEFARLDEFSGLPDESSILFCRHRLEKRTPVEQMLVTVNELLTQRVCCFKRAPLVSVLVGNRANMVFAARFCCGLGGGWALRWRGERLASQSPDGRHNGKSRWSITPRGLGLVVQRSSRMACWICGPYRRQTLRLSVECCFRSASAILPIPWAPALMRNRKDSHWLAKDRVQHGVGNTMSPDTDPQRQKAASPQVLWSGYLGPLSPQT